MRYYMIEQDPEDEDEPCRIYLELNDRGAVQRRVEIYRNGVYIISSQPETAPADLSAMTGDGARLILSPMQFDEIWMQAREMPDGITGMFF